MKDESWSRPAVWRRRWLVMGDRKPYPSDVTDAQWALIGPFLDVWRSRRVSVAGRHGEQDLREVVNAILYQNRTGCQWAYLPHDLPQKPVTYYYFGLWRDDGTPLCQG